MRFDDTRESDVLRHLEDVTKGKNKREIRSILNEEDSLGRSVLAAAVQRNFQNVVSYLLVEK